MLDGTTSAVREGSTHPTTEQRRLARRTIRLSLYAQLLVIDVAVLVVAPLLTEAAINLLGADRGVVFPSTALLFAYLTIAISRGAYSLQAVESGTASLQRALLSYATAVFLVLVVAFFLKSGAVFSRLNFAATICCTTAMLTLLRGYFPRHAKRMAGRLRDELVILDGRRLAFEPGEALVVDARDLNLRPDLNDPAMLNRFGGIVQSFDRVVIDSRPETHRAWALLLKGADVDGEILIEEANEIGAIGRNRFGGTATLQVSRQPLSLPDRVKKRALDLALTVPLMIGLSPVFLAVAIAIKLDSPGPVLFRQERVGRGNRTFHVLKFRSMRAESSDLSGARSASRNDDRVTRVGRFIRKTSIDELPQLLNVLLGDMSLVGPRPHALGSLAGDQLFWQVDESYWLRHQLKPGITGLAQVRGHRGATLERTDLVARLQSDMEYIHRWDIWRDMAILANTLKVVLHRNAF